MQRTFWIRIVLVAGILASVSYAWRVWRAAADSQLALTMLSYVSATVLLAVAALFVPQRERRSGWLTAPALLGVLVLVSATVVEFTSGVAGTVRLRPGAVAELGSASVTLVGFDASYGTGGTPKSWKSDLVLDLAGRPESLTVVSGSPRAVRGIKIFQLGFGLEGNELYSELGLLENNACWPFLGGLGLLSLGAAISLFSARRPQGTVTPGLGKSGRSGFPRARDCV